MSDRKYPDIDFVETDTETIESNLIALYENFVQQVPGRERYKVYPASPESGYAFFWRAGQRDSSTERSSGGYRSQKQRGSKKPEWR